VVCLNPLQVNLNKLLDVHVPELPVGWKRTRGSGAQRWMPQEVKDWKEYLAEEFENEIGALGLEKEFPSEKRMFISINVYYEEDKKIKRTADSDNIAKAILDALTGVVWPDDNPHYVRGHSVWIDFATEESTIGTYIVIYEC